MYYLILILFFLSNVLWSMNNVEHNKGERQASSPISRRNSAPTECINKKLKRVKRISTDELRIEATKEPAPWTVGASFMKKRLHADQKTLAAEKKNNETISAISMAPIQKVRSNTNF